MLAAFTIFGIQFKFMEFDNLNVMDASCGIHWIILGLIALYLIVGAICWAVKRRANTGNVVSWVIFTVCTLAATFFMTCLADLMLILLAYLIFILAFILWLFRPKNAAEKEEKEAEAAPIKEEKEQPAAPAPAKEEKKEEPAAAQVVNNSEKEEEERLAKEAAEKKAAAERLAALNEEEAKKAAADRERKRQEELEARRLQNEKDRQLYIAAMSLSAAPSAKFKLSREDVLDRMDEMFEDKYDYPVEANIRIRSTDRAPDSLRCGVWTFAVMTESKAGIVKFLARMDKKYAEQLKKDHPTIEASAFGGTDDWYKVIIDGTYFAKKEVFMMMDNWYAYVMAKYYKYDAAKKAYITDEEAAEAADSEVVTEATIEIAKKDAAVESAEKERQEADLAMLRNRQVKLSKKKLSANAKKQASDAEVSERDDCTVTGLPLADTYYTPNGISDKGKAKRVCYAYVYQLMDDSTKLIVKLPKVYAERQAEKHPNLCRSKFPAGKSWYVTVIDSTYASEDEVYAMMARAKAFVESRDTRD